MLHPSRVLALCGVLVFAALAHAGPRKDTKVLVQLDAVPLIDAVKWASDLTGKNFVVPEELRQRKLTIVSAKKVTVEEAYAGFLAALDAEGLKVESEGKFVKIMKGRHRPSSRSARDCGLEAHVRKLDERTWVIARAGLDKLLEDTTCWATQARIIPHYKDGQTRGFKLYGIRRGSLYSLLGFQNGDVIKAINGLPITTPDKALEVYQQIVQQSEFKVTVGRRGTEQTLVYRVE